MWCGDVLGGLCIGLGLEWYCGWRVCGNACEDSVGTLWDCLWDLLYTLSVCSLIYIMFYLNVHVY